MSKPATILRKSEQRYAQLDKHAQERVKMLCFGIFFSLATIVAHLAGIQAASIVGPIAGSIAGIELGNMITHGMRRIWPK